MRTKVILILFLLCSGAFVSLWLSAQITRASRAAGISGPFTQTAAAFALTRRVKDIAAPKAAKSPVLSTTGLPVREIGPDNRTFSYPRAKNDVDRAFARTAGIPMPTPLLSFDGLTNYDNIDAYQAVIIPPDMIGDVGPDHYVQAVNALVKIFDKGGNALTSPFRMSQLFAPLGTPCSTRDDGEPVVLYDPLADRWLLSQYCNNFPPFRQMVAISKTGDPTGEYYAYEFVMPNIKLNDVAKFGVWPDGYYMSTEEFTGADFSGTGMFAFDRAKMLAGDPTAAYIYFHRPSASTARLGNLLPADLDGLRPPPANSPNIFVGYTATEYGDAQDAITLYEFHANFSNPSNSSFTESPESPLHVAAFDPTSPEGRMDISQPPPGEKLDSNSDRLMYRAAYRNLGSGESIVVNQTVRVSNVPYRAGVRLYELRRSGGPFIVTEQSTIGDPLSSRWIGSAAQDHQGNLAVGYNWVSDDRQPSIRYSGRLASEPAGTLRSETDLIAGTGVQKAFGWRWGDYSGMTVDPVDDCTFWMTGQYYTLESQEFSDYTWLTRIGSFRFAECTAAPRAFITGTVTDAETGQPLENASVTASVYSRMTTANGSYGSMTVLPGTYIITASAAGYRSESIEISPSNGQTVTQNFALRPIPVLVNTGTSVSAESCGINGAPDPGERVTVAITLSNVGAASSRDLVATLISGGGIVDPGPPQNFGVIRNDGRAVTRRFSFTIDPSVACGSVITMTLQLSDGVKDLGSVTIPLQTGSLKVAYRENFDRDNVGFLPVRWSRSATNSQGVYDRPRNWRVSATRSTSSPKSLFSPDLNQVGINEAITPAFNISSAQARLTFDNWYEFETTFLRNRRYDGSVLEIKIGDGDWSDIIAAGGTFESGGYDGPIDACCQNPLANRPGWSGRSGVNQVSEFIVTSIKMPPSAAGHLVRLRWRVGTDVGGFREGQYIDNLLVTDGFVCSCSGQ